MLIATDAARGSQIHGVTMIGEIGSLGDEKVQDTLASRCAKPFCGARTLSTAPAWNWSRDQKAMTVITAKTMALRRF